MRPALALLLLACKSPPPPPHAADALPASASASASVSPPTPSPARPPVLSLLSPGTPPLTPLRLAPRLSPQHLTITTRTTSSSLPVPVPTISLDVDVLPLSTSPSSIDYSFTLTDARATDAPSSSLSAARASLSSARGTSGLARITPQGATVATQLSLPDSAPPQLAQLLGGLHDSFDAMSIPLPTEPVGVGARWQLVATIAPNGLPTTTTTTYELTQLTGTVAHIATTVSQSAADPSLTLTTTGTGTLELDLSEVVPSRSTSTTTTQSTVRPADGTEPVTVKLTVVADVAPR